MTAAELRRVHIPGDATTLTEREERHDENGGCILKSFSPVKVFWDSSKRGEYPIPLEELIHLMQCGRMVFITDGNEPFVGVMMDAQVPTGGDITESPPSVLITLQPIEPAELAQCPPAATS